MRTLCAAGSFERIKKGNKISRNIYKKTDRQNTIPSNREKIRTKTKVNALIHNCIDEAKESLSNKNAKAILISNKHQISNKMNTTFLAFYNISNTTPSDRPLNLKPKRA